MQLNKVKKAEANQFHDGNQLLLLPSRKTSKFYIPSVRLKFSYIPVFPMNFNTNFFNFRNILFLGTSKDS